MVGCSRVIVQSLTVPQVVALWRNWGIPPEHRHLHCNPSCIRIDLCSCRHRQGHEHFVFLTCIVFPWQSMRSADSSFSFFLNFSERTSLLSWVQPLGLQFFSPWEELQSGCVWIKHIFLSSFKQLRFSWSPAWVNMFWGSSDGQPSFWNTSVSGWHLYMLYICFFMGLASVAHPWNLEAWLHDCSYWYTGVWTLACTWKAGRSCQIRSCPWDRFSNLRSATTYIRFQMRFPNPWDPFLVFAGNLWGQVSKAPAPQLNTARQWRASGESIMQTRPILFWGINGSDRIEQPVINSINLHICHILLSEAKFDAGVINGLYRELKAGSGNRPELHSALSWDSSNMTLTKHDETCMFLLAGWTHITTGSCDTTERRGGSDCLSALKCGMSDLAPDDGWPLFFPTAEWCFLLQVVSRSGKREDIIEFMQVKDSKSPVNIVSLVAWKKLGGGSSWERRDKWHGGWYLDSKLTFQTS